MTHVQPELLTELEKIQSKKYSFTKYLSGRAQVAYACNPNYLGGRDWEIKAGGHPGQKVRPYLKNT
jgi:hypothetical protein